MIAWIVVALIFLFLVVAPILGGLILICGGISAVVAAILHTAGRNK